MKMNKSILVILLLLISVIGYAQTNTFPSSGNVGIGTTAPNGLLDIKGQNDSHLIISPDNTHVHHIISYRDLVFNSFNGFYFRNSNISGDYGQFSELMKINKNGNVGIGTNNPNHRLHIFSGNSGGSGHSYSKVTLEHSDNAMFSILTPNNKNAYFGFADSDDNYVGGMQYSHTSNTMTFRVNNHGNDVVINANGNMGIGTTNPTEKLVVNGKILAEEVKVQTVPASDYVFESDYDLRPIEEVESFIQENKHLPDIPSAEEFKENGVGLGEMGDMLLRKVEELMLYVIELKKENENQNKEILQLKTKLNTR